MQRLKNWLIVRLLSARYVPGSPEQLALHDLHRQLADMRRERDHWKTRAIVAQLKAM